MIAACALSASAVADFVATLDSPGDAQQAPEIRSLSVLSQDVTTPPELRSEFGNGSTGRMAVLLELADNRLPSSSGIAFWLDIDGEAGTGAPSPPGVDVLMTITRYPGATSNWWEFFRWDADGFWTGKDIASDQALPRWTYPGTSIAWTQYGCRATSRARLWVKSWVDADWNDVAEAIDVAPESGAGIELNQANDYYSDGFLWPGDGDCGGAGDAGNAAGPIVQKKPPIPRDPGQPPGEGPALPPTGDDTGAAEPPRCAGLRATMIGTQGNDLLRGTPRDDVIVGLGGRDGVFGNGGNDVICAGPGDDRLHGGPGADRLYGQGGKDLITGQGDGDRLLGGPGRDHLLGGPGDDLLSGQAGNDFLDGGGDRDDLRGGPGADFLLVERARDRWNGGPGIDRGRLVTR